MKLCNINLHRTSQIKYMILCDCAVLWLAHYCYTVKYKVLNLYFNWLINLLFIFSHSEATNIWKSNCYRHPLCSIVSFLYLNSTSFKISDHHIEFSIGTQLFHGTFIRYNRVDVRRIMEHRNRSKISRYGN